jgi:hypothetical protein
MPDFKALLSEHKMLGENSCVAWGFEFLAKWHGNMAWNEFPLQQEYEGKLGFSQRDTDVLRLRYRVDAKEVSVTFKDLQDLLSQECKKDCPPLLSVFSGIHVEHQYLQDTSDDSAASVKRIILKIEHHIYVGMERNGGYLFGCRFWQQDKIIWMWMDGVEALCRAEAHVSAICVNSSVSDGRHADIRCLLHHSL